jgi:hypothetical protein
MLSSQATEPETTGLQAYLSEIAEIDRKTRELEDEADRLGKRRQHLERLAVEEMLEQRLDGVRVAGRSWRVEYDHSMSVSQERRDAVLAAAKAEGVEKEVAMVNTARLKAILKEKAKAAGKPAHAEHSAGTAFEGLVGEFVQPRIRHVTLPRKD